MGEYVPMVSIDSCNVGDGYLWAGKPGPKSKVIDVRQLKKNVHINVNGSFDNSQKQGWYDKTTSTGVDIIDMREEQKLLSAATNMCRAVFRHKTCFPTNCRMQKKASHLFKGEMVLVGKHHFEYNRSHQYRSTANVKHNFLWVFVTRFMLLYSHVLHKYLLKFVICIRYMFREYGIVPSGIVGGYEALSDHLIVTQNLATPHHKDTKDVYDSFGLWLQEDKTKEKKNWYFVLPNLKLSPPNSPYQGVFIKLFHGVGIKWNGRKLVHFTSDECYDETKDNVYSVFFNANRGITMNKRILELPKEVENGVTCCICLEDFQSDPNDLVFLDCLMHHPYHMECLVTAQANKHFEQGGYYVCELCKQKSNYLHPMNHLKRPTRCVICDKYFRANRNVRKNDEANIITTSDNVYIYPCCNTVVHSDCHMYHQKKQSEEIAVASTRNETVTCKFTNEEGNPCLSTSYTESISFYVEQFRLYGTLRNFVKRYPYFVGLTAPRKYPGDIIPTIYRCQANNNLLHYCHFDKLSNVKWKDTQLNDRFQCFTCQEDLPDMSWLPKIDRNKCAFCWLCQTYYLYSHLAETAGV